MLVVLGRVQLLPSLLQRVVPGVHGPAIERSLLLKAPPPRLDVLLAPPARGTGQTVRAIGKGPRVPGVRSAWPASLGGSARRGTAASARGSCRTAAAQARHPPPSWNAGRRPCTRRRPSLALTFGSAERCVQRARPRSTLVPAHAAIVARSCLRRSTPSRAPNRAPPATGAIQRTQHAGNADLADLIGKKAVTKLFRRCKFPKFAAAEFWAAERRAYANAAAAEVGGGRAGRCLERGALRRSSKGQWALAPLAALAREEKGRESHRASAHAGRRPGHAEV